MPNYICDFLYNVCDYANTFYECNRIKTESDPAKKSNWLALLLKTTQMLKDMLGLLIIEIPSVM